MLKRTIRPLSLLFLVVLLVATACSSGQPQETPAPQVTEEPPAKDTATSVPPTEEVEMPPEELISSIGDAQSGVILIQAEGTFVDPEFGLQVNSAGRGTGFIIDQSGLAVTNNHVVTGAALVKVKLAGEDNWRNARVLGVSECADLAVIDIDGDGYPYFDWFTEPVNVGNEIYVAGFPLGDPEFTLTKGIISKARADGESNWASVDSVFEYDANVLPGNSGGPVLDADTANVLGIHYASNKDTRQAFGISHETAKSVIDRLSQNEDVDSVGINATAVSNEDGSITGIWVSSVESGSPADNAGIKPGDLLYQMEGLVLATDGTLADYCDILRSHQREDTLNVNVIRWDAGELYEGQLNGRELAYTGTFGSAETNTTDDSNTPSDSDLVETNSGMYNFNASASGDIAFGTDFDGGDLSDFFYFLTNGNDSDFGLYVENNVLRWETTGQYNWAYLVNDQIEMTDIQIDVSAENLGSNNNNTSLICRYSDAGWYEFNIANDGTWTILRYDSNVEDYTALYTGGSYAINMGQDVNDYTAVCVGNQLSLYINGELTRTVNDSKLKSGLAGISVSSFDSTPVILEFDYLVFSIP